MLVAETLILILFKLSLVQLFQQKHVRRQFVHFSSIDYFFKRPRLFSPKPLHFFN